tara:strand:+ start:2481 stop:2765 length:285 start_codon:yes stop_codon:yes gene_type:complete
MSTPLEKSVEDFLDEEVQRRGGFTVKLNPKGYKGIPDRLVVLPDRMFVAELKRPKNGRVAKLQGWWNKRFADLGHEAVFIKSRAEVLDVLGTCV